MIINKKISKCATTLALILSMSQTLMAPSVALANEMVSESSNVLAKASGYTQTGEIIQFHTGNSLLRESGNSYGKLTKYYSDTMYISLPYIEITGEDSGAVWCINPDKGFPVNIQYAKEVYNDEGICNILYYAVKNGWDQPNENYIDVFVALNSYLGHSYQGIDLTSPVFTSAPNVAYLLQKARDKDAPTGHFDIKNKVQVADFDKNKKLQVTDWYTPETDGKGVTYDIPTDIFDSEVSVELSNGTILNAKTGTHAISADVQFRLIAPANYTKSIKFDLPTNHKKLNALIFKPTSDDVQTVVKAGGIKDPISVLGVEATFFARTGQFKLKKTSEVSELPMEGVGFKVEMSTGEILELLTDENGLTPLSKDYDFGTTGKVTEIRTPAGYVALENPISFTIEAGTIIEVSIENKVQKGKVKAQKFEEVYEAQETWENGVPTYSKQPAANREFDIVRQNDHTLPDLQTVIGTAGEVVDHVVTDSEGNFESNVELYIGSQNQYKLIETNVPDNYRKPSDVQTEFSIPYGNNTEKLVLFDQGEIDNELKTAEIIFNKKNALNLAGLNLAGAEFLVQGLTNDVRFILTTENESSILKLLADKGTATYTFTEIKRPNGFGQVEGETDTRVITVNDGESITVDWENMPLVPKVGISTKAHTGDGVTNTFVWGEDVLFYDDVNLTHSGINSGTERAFETILVAVYADGEQDVWSSGKIDYIVTDKQMTEKVIAEYDYKQDPKGTHYYFKEIGYAKDGDNYVKDTEHNFNGKDPQQMITPVTKTNPQKTVLPSTGEKSSVAGILIGSIISVSLIAYAILQNKKKTI